MSTLQDDPWGFAAGGESDEPAIDNHSAFEAAARAAADASWAARADRGLKGRERTAADRTASSLDNDGRTTTLPPISS